MRKYYGIYAAAAIAVLAAFVFGSLVMNQSNFYTKAAQSGMAEINLSQLALQKSGNENIKAFAQRMIDDHTAANEELAQIAANKNVTLPTEVSSKQKRAMDKLEGLSGEDFDRGFLKQMVKDHTAAVKLFQKEAQSGSDAETKAFAAKTLPKLQSHLRTAQTLSGNMKGMNQDRNRDNNMNSNSNMDMNMNSNDNMNSDDMDMNRNMNSNDNMDMDMNTNSDDDMDMNSNMNSDMNMNSNMNSNMNMNSNSNRNMNMNSDPNRDMDRDVNSNGNPRLLR